MTTPAPVTDPLATIVLAAGKGTRMKSDLHKVLHPIAGRPMLLHLLDAAGALAPARTVVVVGAGRAQVAAAVSAHGVAIAEQAEQLGTGHAVAQARGALADFAGDVLVLYGDVPLVTTDTMRRMLDRLHGDDAPAMVVLGFRPPDPGAYGRVIVAPGTDRVERIVEFKDADAAERAETLCNSGLMAARAADLFRLLDRVGNDNAAGEYYLTDLVMLAGEDGRTSAVIEVAAAEVAGVNSRAELAGVEAAWQAARRLRAMADGATLLAPDTVYFAHDTVVGRDVTIGQHVVFGPGTRVADGATIHAFSQLEGATVGAAAEVGPYARLRPGAVLGERSKIGNFVEVKKTVLGAGAKANHLTYLGDATVGAGANIGAGTITCNYDGFFKYPTTIGEGAFIGSNSALVAPVAIGAGAIVGAGSVVTANVTENSLALVRAAQQEKPGWAARFRAAMRAKKDAR
jgi:bifunctional UDP-N-acetylglucosamine pyrophosphorylase/glucosamine-1-phosphate N-acetyltransferase